MAQTIKIKRSSSSAAPTSLSAGELAYSSNSQKLFIGAPSDGTVTTIGGDLYVAMLDHTAGTLTASSAILVDAQSKVDQFKSGNIVVTGSSDTISTSSGNLTIAPTGDLVVTHGGAIDVDAQATDLLIADNEAASFVIKEGTTPYLSFITTNGSESINVGTMSLNTGGTLEVTSSANVGSNLGVTGNITVNTNKFTVSSGEGNTSISGTLGVTNAATFSSGVTITGALAGNGAVTLGDASTDTITINGNATFGNTADFNGGLNVASTNTIDMGGNRVRNIGTPTQATDATTKAYVDSVKQALDIKDSVRVATAAAISGTYDNGTGGVGATLTADANGAISIDGVTLVSGNRVLVKNQTTTTQNGLYSVTTVGDGSTAFVLTRVTDADSSAEVTGGLFTFVEEGSTNADQGFVLTSITGSATLGTDNLVFTQFSGAGQITAGNGLLATGNTLDVRVDDTTIEINSDILRIKGIGSVSEGDLIFGANGGSSYTRLAIGAYDSSNSVGQVLQVGANGTITWTNTLDGGTF